MKSEVYTYEWIDKAYEHEDGLDGTIKREIAKILDEFYCGDETIESSTDRILDLMSATAYEW